MRLFLMRFLHWNVDQFENVWNPDNCQEWILERKDVVRDELRRHLRGRRERKERERERERERGRERERERERERKSVCVCVCVYERGRVGAAVRASWGY
jgi:hypothetical protein